MHTLNKLKLTCVVFLYCSMKAGIYGSYGIWKSADNNHLLFNCSEYKMQGVVKTVFCDVRSIPYATLQQHLLESQEGGA